MLPWCNHWIVTSLLSSEQTPAAPLVKMIQTQSQIDDVLRGAAQVSSSPHARLTQAADYLHRTASERYAPVPPSDKETPGRAYDRLFGSSVLPHASSDEFRPVYVDGKATYVNPTLLLRNPADDSRIRGSLASFGGRLGVDCRAMIPTLTEAPRQLDIDQTFVRGPPQPTEMPQNMTLHPTDERSLYRQQAVAKLGGVLRRAQAQTAKAFGVKF